ncbi:metallophosphoesterase [Helicovermis profundi]|uniref:Metallophosphoesterase n=1 Tax=Helicovermis profundi TaxID=3065157 RepID=A0AAU9E741_9FIRM|nr:metallophosphoesterase [Clostridia bacterium S502]
MLSNIINIDEKDNYRIVAISDVHGHKNVLEKLINKVDLADNDYLIIIGDFVNRGIDSYETYEYIKTLSKRERTIILKGNHEFFMQKFLTNREKFTRLLSFLKAEPYETIIGTIVKKENIDLHTLVDENELFNMVNNKYKEMIDFLSKLPIIVQFDEFTFVHGGFDESFSIDKDEDKFLKYDDYNNLSKINDKKIVVGHWPAGNLRENILTNKPFFNNDKNIVFIDGGLGVKKSGELNALIIEKRNNELSYSFMQENMFKSKSILREHSFNTEEIVFVDYPHFEFEVLELGKSMAKCKHLHSNKEFSVFTSLLFLNEGKYELKIEYVNKFLNLKVDELVEVCAEFEDCLLVKHNEEFGWIMSFQV